jgi:tetratricopeptide (TPR) repeat protein
MRLLRFSWFGLVAAIALGAGLTSAADTTSPYPECTKKPTPADIEGAKGAHKAASQFYDRGDYDKAVRYWTDAYGFDCTAHGVLINIANAYEKKGDKQAAVTALEVYLKRAGNDGTIEEKVKNLKASLATAPTVAPTVTAAPTVAPSAAPTATAPPPDGPRPYGYKPWVMVGAGGVVAIVGAILIPVGIGAYNAAEELCPEHKTNPNAVCPPEVASKGNTARIEQGIGVAALGIGIAAAAGGLVWQLVYNKPTAAAPNTGVRVLPAAGPSGGGLTLQGVF